MCFSLEVDTDLLNISKLYSAELSRKYFQEFKSNFEQYPKEFKTPSKEGTIYPNTFASVIVEENSQRVLRPMRYRLRPSWSEKEIPSKYNLFNARSDSLLDRKTWSGLIGRKHAILVFNKFYEWVEYQGEKRLIHFKAKNCRYMVAPALWDSWQGEDYRIDSFAIITKDPNPEILQAGHDRSPIFLKDSSIDEWLKPQARSANQWQEFLGNSNQVYGTEVYYENYFGL